MAGALVGEALLSAALEVLLERMASLPVLDLFKGQKLTALNKLAIKMNTIKKVLDDADDKQHTDSYVEQWLDELKNVVYEAEDLLDEFASEVQRSNIEPASQTIMQKMKGFVPSLFNTRNKKLEEILGTLEYLVEQKDALGLGPTCGAGGKPSYERTPTTSFPDESVIYGRDDDKEDIMKWVLSDHPNSINNPEVLAIVGIGGLGKTTLAQHVYRDRKTAGYFDKMAWICVSEEEFDVPKVTKNILEGFTKPSSDANNLDTLQTRLEEVLKEKKFLLVLDDVWSKHYDEWDNLLKPLRSGKEGSKILVTTRNQDVANCIETSPTHQLKKLTDEDCWSLFEKHAFKGTHMSSVHPDLERIGRQIVQKCGGLPLAAKLLGGGLRSERNPEKWKKILEEDRLDVQKDRTLPILRLSYRFLPSHLKRCFAYCAVFPKDYEFEKEKLIRLWMAEGLLPQHKMNNVEIEEVEEVGENCFDALVSRSFFQKSGVTDSFLMHDLINDLAKSISREFCYRHRVDGPCKKTEWIRHLWLDYDEDGEVHLSIPIQHLRTILGLADVVKVENWLPTLTRCRVFACQCAKLPDSIGNLMHLCYLDLSFSSMQRLPDTVTSLCNLETLILYGCKSLVELPATIFKLINLSLLDIRRTNLRKMPPHMGKLTKLGELDYYIVGRESDCSIKELGPLKRLRGYLRIEKLRNVSQVQEAAEASLKRKEKLKELELIWNDKGSENSLQERNVLEQLRPHTNIEQLSISGYAGTRFPDWVGDSSFSNMVELNLKRCRYCTSLPALGQLGSLKRLSIRFCDSLERLLLDSAPALEELKVKGCEDLEEILLDSAPALEELKVTHCHNLEKILLDSVPALEGLIIKNCCHLEEIQPTHLPSLNYLFIERCDRLVSLPRAPALEWLIILGDFRHEVILRYRNYSYSPLEMVEQLMALELKNLAFGGWELVTSFPLHLFPMLESLRIFRCLNLEFLSAASQAQPLLRCTDLELLDCPNLKRLLSMHNCPESTVVDLLRIFPNLSHLRLFRCCEEEESFPPEDMLLPPTLTSLGISEFPNLKSFDNTALQSLTCLRELTIEHCPELQSIPIEGLLSSLESVSIQGCPLLHSETYRGWMTTVGTKGGMVYRTFQKVE